MIGNRHGVCSLLGAALLAFGLCGCDQKMPAWTGLDAPPQRLPGVASPNERIQSLRDLAQKAQNTPDPGQREAICRDLAQQIRKEPDSIIRGEILRTMSAYGGDMTVAVLRAAVKDPDADVRVIVCGLWGRRTDSEAAQVLADILAGDSDHDVRMAAARALSGSRDPIAIRALGGALDDKDPAMQYRAMVSLKSATGKDFGNDVEKWRQYVKTGQVHDDRSLTQRIFWWYY